MPRSQVRSCWVLQLSAAGLSCVQALSTGGRASQQLPGDEKGKGSVSELPWHSGLWGLLSATAVQVHCFNETLVFCCVSLGTSAYQLGSVTIPDTVYPSIQAFIKNLMHITLCVCLRCARRPPELGFLDL